MVLYEITPTRHPGMLLAGVQQFKELDSGQSLSRQALGREPAGMTKEEFHPFVLTLGVMGVRKEYENARFVIPARGRDLDFTVTYEIPLYRSG
jgi:hypothetical protein